MLLRVVDLLLVAFVDALGGELLGDDLPERVAGADLRSRGRREQAAREEHPVLDELVSGNLGCTQGRSVGEAGDDSTHPDRASPDPVRGGELGGARKLHHRRQVRDPDRPVLAPHAQVHVDDVVVGDGEPAKPVRDRERAPLVGRLVVPDDPEPVLDVRHPEAVRQAEAAELGVGAGPVDRGALADRDVRDRLAGAERDVAIRAAVRAGEVERDLLAREERAVGLDGDEDIGVRQGVRLRGSSRRRQKRDGNEDRDEPLQLENWTDGASRVTSSVSK